MSGQKRPDCDLTDDELVAIMKEAVVGYGRKFAFTYQGVEDVEQRAWELALEGLAKFDESKGDVRHFLRVHIRNRLINDKRDLYIRDDLPCKKCPLLQWKDRVCQEYTVPEMECEWLAPWHKRNQSRKYIAHPIAMDSVDPIGESNMEYTHGPFKDLEMGEIWDIIESELPEDIAMLYWVWKTGYKPDKKRRCNLSDKERESVEVFVRERVGHLYGD